MTPANRISDDHFQAWLSQVNEACGHFNGRKLDPGFIGQLEKCQVGQISMSIVDMTQVNLFRGQREIRASSADHYYAVLQMAGTSRIEHQDACIELQAGDLTLIDASTPLDMHFHQRSRQLSLILPRSQVQSGTRGVGVACARRIEATTPLASIARLMMLEAGRTQHMANHESQAVLDALVTVLRPAIAQDAIPGSHERMFRKALALIDQNIRNRRLDFCAESLRNPAMDQKVSSLGYAWGFSDSSYFSTAFKGRFGMTPGEYRKRHAN